MSEALPGELLALLVPTVLVVLALVLLGAMLLALFLGLRLGRRAGRMEAEKGFREEELAARGDAVKRSRAVLTGQIGEQLAPYFPDFPGSTADARFLGKPVDYIVFSGASTGSVKEVLFVEIKTGAARLSGPERSLKEAIQAGRVRWVEYRLPLPSS